MGLAVFSKTQLGGFTASSSGPGADVCWWCVQKPLSAASWMTAAWDCSSPEPSCWDQEGGDDDSTPSTEVLACCAVAGAPLSDYTRPSQAQIFCTCLCLFFRHLPIALTVRSISELWRIEHCSIKLWAIVIITFQVWPYQVEVFWLLPVLFCSANISQPSTSIWWCFFCLNASCCAFIAHTGNPASCPCWPFLKGLWLAWAWSAWLP